VLNSTQRRLKAWLIAAQHDEWIEWVLQGGSLRPLESLRGWLPTTLKWISKYGWLPYFLADCLTADCRPRWSGFNDIGWLPGWRGRGINSLDAYRSTEEGTIATLYSSREFSPAERRRPNELLKVDRGRSRRRVDTTIKNDAFTFWMVKKKLRKRWQCNRIAMAVDLRRTSQKKQWEESRRGGRKFEFRIFPAPRNVWLQRPRISLRILHFSGKTYYIY